LKSGVTPKKWKNTILNLKFQIEIKIQINIFEFELT